MTGHYALAFALTFAAAAPAAAAVVVERFPPAGPLAPGVASLYAPIHLGPGVAARGQTITVQTSGRLVMAEILVENLPVPIPVAQPDYRFDLFAGPEGGLLASATAPTGPTGPLAWRGVDLSANNIFVQAGDVLLLSVGSVAPTSFGWLWRAFTSANPASLYAGGEALTFADCATQPSPSCGRWLPDTFDGQAIDFSYRLTIDATPDPIPEPASWALMILGFGGAGGVLRARRARVAFAA